MPWVSAVLTAVKEQRSRAAQSAFLLNCTIDLTVAFTNVTLCCKHVMQHHCHLLLHLYILIDVS